MLVLDGGRVRFESRWEQAVQQWAPRLGPREAGRLWRAGAVPCRPRYGGPMIAGGSDWALSEGGRWFATDLAASDSAGITVTAGGTANTDGSIVALMASTPDDADLMIVGVSNNSAGAVYLLDILVGASGAEGQLVADVFFQGARANQMSVNAMFGCQIPTASRLSARVRSATASATAQVLVNCFNSAWGTEAPLTRVDTYGSTPASSTGTSITAGGANAEGSWTQLVASTDNEMRALTLLVGQGPANTTARSLLDIGFGASGAEGEMVRNLPFATNTTADEMQPKAYSMLPVSIPKASRLVARQQSTTGSLALVICAYGMG